MKYNKLCIGFVNTKTRHKKPQKFYATSANVKEYSVHKYNPLNKKFEKQLAVTKIIVYKKINLLIVKIYYYNISVTMTFNET